MGLEPSVSLWNSTNPHRLPILQRHTAKPFLPNRSSQTVPPKPFLPKRSLATVPLIESQCQPVFVERRRQRVTYRTGYHSGGSVATGHDHSRIRWGGADRKKWTSLTTEYTEDDHDHDHDHGEMVTWRSGSSADFQSGEMPQFAAKDHGVKLRATHGTRESLPGRDGHRYSGHLLTWKLFGAVLRWAAAFALGISISRWNGFSRATC
jgi:hypothetical protein